MLQRLRKVEPYWYIILVIALVTGSIYANHLNTHETPGRVAITPLTPAAPSRIVIEDASGVNAGGCRSARPSLPRPPEMTPRTASTVTVASGNACSGRGAEAETLAVGSAREASCGHSSTS